jgi:hypothetical protein
LRTDRALDRTASCEAFAHRAPIAPHRPRHPEHPPADRAPDRTRDSAIADRAIGHQDRDPDRAS